MNTQKLALTALVLIAFAMPVFAQGRFSLSVHAGPNGNFSVRRINEATGQQIGDFSKKNFIGLVFETEAKFALNERSWLLGGYMRSKNSREINYSQNASGVNVIIEDFTISSKENKFYVGFEREISRKIRGLNALVGAFYSTYEDESIQVGLRDVNVYERNVHNAGFNDLGAFVGLHYERKIDTHFKFGIQSRVYFNITAVYFEQVTLTPTLTYTFSKKK